MKAAIWYGHKDIKIRDVSEPSSPETGKVKIKVHWCGICGTDVHKYLAPISPHHNSDIITGHEFSGEVVEIGSGVDNINIGDRVVVDTFQVCGECYFCKRNLTNLCMNSVNTGVTANGGFAEYVNVPSYTVYKLPATIPSDVGAVIEPLAVGAHAVRRAQILQGDTVTILGAGTIGLATLQAARAAGASKVFVIEMNKFRLEIARNLGADAVFDPTQGDVIAQIREATAGLGTDIAFECIGNHNTVPVAIKSTRRGGKIVIVGVFNGPTQINLNQIVLDEKQMIGSMGYQGEFPLVIDLLNNGRIKAEPLITGKVKLDDIVTKGFEELVNRPEKHIKILIEP